jgi:hypothetical protein
MSLGALTLLSGTAQAERLGRGSSLLLVGIGGHRGEFVAFLPPLPSLSFPGSLSRYETGEIGGEIAYYRFVSDRWTIGVSGGYHASSRKTEVELSEVTDTHSFTARIGSDRYAFIDDNVALFAGPGVFFRRGRWSSTDPVVDIDGPDATETGLNGRIGVYARVHEGWALFGFTGYVLSYTSGKNEIGKISWWGSTNEGSMGIAFEL